MILNLLEGCKRGLILLQNDVKIYLDFWFSLLFIGTWKLILGILVGLRNSGKILNLFEEYKRGLILLENDIKKITIFI